MWSSVRAGAAAAARAKKLNRARDDLARLGRGLGGRYYPSVTEVNERLAGIAAKRRVKAYLISEVSVDEAGKPTLARSFDQAAIDTEAATDGW